MVSAVDTTAALWASSRSTSALPAADVSPTSAGSTKARLARYVLNTKVVTTALNAADPQSHSAQETSARRSVRCGTTAAGEAVMREP